MTQRRTFFRIMAVSWGIVLAVVAVFYGLSLIGYRFTINPTPSIAPGVYLIDTHERTPQAGATVVFDPPADAARVLYGRGYLAPGAPLIKHVYAIAGDRYCITDERITVNGKALGPVSAYDSLRRPLPRLRGCFSVEAAHFLPLGLRIPNSYDGRYFGAVPNARIIGTARLLVGF